MQTTIQKFPIFFQKLYEIQIFVAMFGFSIHAWDSGSVKKGGKLLNLLCFLYRDFNLKRLQMGGILPKGGKISSLSMKKRIQISTNKPTFGAVVLKTVPVMLETR